MYVYRSSVLLFIDFKKPYEYIHRSNKYHAEFSLPMKLVKLVEAITKYMEIKVKTVKKLQAQSM